ncbi:MAG: M20/M25/M40 family metallo-hydrolase [Acidobacteriota bacterium]
MKSLPWIVAAVGAAAAAMSSFAGQTDPAAPSNLLTTPAVAAALEAAKAMEGQTIDDQIRFCEVPAPPFKERARGEVLRQAFQQAGLRNVRVDRAGNVLGDRPGMAARPRLVLAAHLDTVFPEETDVTVKRDGAILRGPGIGDDCRGLAVLIAIVKSLGQARLQTAGALTFVATVGEEGLGDLRGVRELFAAAMDIDRFVAIDGPGLGVTNVGAGSRRYRVAFKGPGGHSFSAFGLASPIEAMGRAITRIAEFQVAKDPKTTFNVGRVGGGTSVNAIPADAWMEVDLRSVDAASLTALDAKFLRAVDAAVAEENDRRRSPGAITATRERVGDRPAGSTPAGAPIVKAAEAVHRALRLPFVLSESSTDANLPMSLGIPSITIGGGGRGADAHALTESFDTTDAWIGTQRALLLTLTLAQK